MKKVLLLISFALMAVCSANLSAQTPNDKYGPNSAECLKYISYYEEYYKQKNYDSALPNWRKAYELCPVTSRYKILQDGTTLMKYLIKKNELNPAYKEKLVDSLMTIYHKRIEYWPKYNNNTLNYYATDMYNYLQDKPQELFKGLNDVIGQLGAKTDLKTFPLYMKVACDLYKEGNLEVEDVLGVYENSMKYLGEVVTEGNEIKQRLLEKTSGDVDAIFGASGVADSDNLVAIYAPKFEADPENVELAKSIASKLAKTEGGTDTDLFMSTMTLWYSKEPSANAAYMLFKLNSSRGETDAAYKYMEEAINSEDSDIDTDAEYYFELAAFAFKSGNSAKAVDAASKAVEMSDVVDGKAYMLMGTVWSSVVCPGNEIEQRAKYWVATDYMNKAKSADASLTEDCNNYISQFRVYYPQTAEAFMYDVTDGQSYTVSCAGMRATTTVRTQK
jgi:tetratricopeptide (TPR) repeat protein